MDKIIEECTNVKSIITQGVYKYITELAKNLDSLKLIQTPSAGTDWLEKSKLYELGVSVSNNGGGNAVAVAEHAIALMFSVYRKLDLQISNVKSDSVPSLMRNFSAPVRLNADLNSQELLKLVKYENDDFNRWEAVQKLHLYYFYKGGSIQFFKVINDLLARNILNYSIMSLILQIPSLKMLEQNKDLVDPLQMFFKREEYLKNFCKE